MAAEKPLPTHSAPGLRAAMTAWHERGRGSALASQLRHRLGAWGAGGVLLTVLAASVHLGWTMPRQQQAEALARSLAEAEGARQQRPPTLPQAQASATTEPELSAAHRTWQVLPLQAQRHADLQRLTAAVSDAQVVLERADLRQVNDGGPLLHEEWQLRLYGPYPQQRRLLQKLRGHLPNAALHALAIDRDSSPAEIMSGSEPGRPAAESVRLQVTLRLYYRRHEETR